MNEENKAKIVHRCNLLLYDVQELIDIVKNNDIDDKYVVHILNDISSASTRVNIVKDNLLYYANRNE